MRSDHRKQLAQITDRSGGDGGVANPHRYPIGPCNREACAVAEGCARVGIWSTRLWQRLAERAKHRCHAQCAAYGDQPSNNGIPSQGRKAGG